ncbi:hypothetical protein EV426DRAFT_590730 [Tirmania nivea]|nr:hypothetical protein EV426DRAFT_590730 [Tirmania nivea]
MESGLHQCALVYRVGYLEQLPKSSGKYPSFTSKKITVLHYLDIMVPRTNALPRTNSQFQGKYKIKPRPSKITVMSIISTTSTTPTPITPLLKPQNRHANNPSPTPSPSRPQTPRPPPPSTPTPSHSSNQAPPLSTTVFPSATSLLSPNPTLVVSPY